MTVSSTTNSHEYNGDGSQVVFPYVFKIFAATDLVVVKRDNYGTEVTLVLNTDYYVSGVGNPSGGNVTCVTAPGATDKLLIRRVLPLTQETDYKTGDSFPAEAHESALDRLVMISQQLNKNISDLPQTATGFAWKGLWSAATAYVLNDVVFREGSSYVCILAHTNHVPPNSTYWDIMAQVGTTGPAGSLPISAAGGTADAITATYSPPFTSLADKIQCRVVAAYANATTTPTFSPDGLTAKTIVRGSNQPLVAGDIAGANHPVDLEFNASLDKWVLMNPAKALLTVATTCKGLFTRLVIQTVSNTAIDVDADQVIVEDSSYIPKVCRAVNLTINTGTSGANGLDTGTIAADTWYAVYVIYNPTSETVAGLISLSATSPTMPSGYTYAARFGWVRTDGSSNLKRTLQRDHHVQYVHTSGVPLPLLCSGVAGNVSTPTWVAVPVGDFIPTTAKSVILNTLFASGSWIIAPNNTYGGSGDTTNPCPLSLNVAYTGVFKFLLESTNIYWASNAAGNKIFCFGWTD